MRMTSTFTGSKWRSPQKYPTMMIPMQSSRRRRNLPCVMR